MTGTKFDLVVLGQEPGALWLLKALKQSIPKIRLAWVRSELSHRPTLIVDNTLCNSYGIPLKDPWSAEFVTPGNIFFWSATELERRFKVSGPHTPKALLAHLQRAPELLGLCEALWKRLGIVSALSPETYLQSLQQVQFTFWEPEFEDLTQATLKSPEEISRIDYLERGEFQLAFEDSVWDTKHLVLALSFPELEILFRQIPNFNRWIHVPSTQLPGQGLLPLTLRVKKHHVPRVLSPMTLIFETIHTPNSETDVLLIDFKKGDLHDELTLWIESEYPFKMDNSKKRANLALKRIFDRMPMLESGVVKTSISLEPSVATDEAELLRYFVPKFSHARLHTHHTKHHQISWIAPDSGCQLPSPSGSLAKGRDIWREIVGKKLSKSTSPQLNA